MVYLFLISIILIVIGCWSSSSIVKDNIRKGILFKEYGAMYLGGFPDIIGGKADIEIKENGVFINCKHNGSKFIFAKNIISSEIKTNTQIEEEISLGKILLFGVFSLGMKNRNTVVKNYIDIKYNDNGTTRDIILESKQTQNLINTLRRLKK
jgi:hypothetical protein